MSMFTLAISCLTTSNLPWFIDLTFKVPMQYCSLQHRTLLPSPFASTTGCCVCFGSISSLFLELFLHSSPVAYRASTALGSSSITVYLFAFSYCSWGSQGKNTEVVCIPFSTGPCFVRTLLNDLSVLGGPTQHGLWFHWIRQGCGPCDQFDYFSVILIFILSALWWIRIRGLWKLPDGKDWLWGKLSLEYSQIFIGRTDAEAEVPIL